MNNKKFELLIDEAYLTYREEALSAKEAYESGDLLGSQPHVAALFKDPEELILLDRESFFQKCKSESDFAKRWNLEIQERAMTWEEQVEWVMRYTDVEMENLYIVEEVHKPTTPKKILSLQKGEEKVEAYSLSHYVTYFEP